MSDNGDRMKEHIKKFVKKTLGCLCPDEVFEHIEHERNIKIDSDIVLKSRINIGNRLLVYIISINSERFIVNNLKSIVFYGVDERDARGFNRFRLVLETVEPGKLEKTARSVFSSIKNKDEKTHLHIVKKSL
jgi:hypothetical protein